jgi:hypothetical protein
VIAANVAARLGMQTRKAATESHATTGMASVKAAAHMSAAEPAAYMTAATEPASVSTSTAARKRVGGQSPGECGSRQQRDHCLT